MRHSTLSCLCLFALFTGSLVQSTPESPAGNSWLWSAKSEEAATAGGAGVKLPAGGSDPVVPATPAEVTPRKSRGFSFPGPQAGEKDDIPTIPLNPVSQGVPLVSQSNQQAAYQGPGLTPKDVLATVANLQDEPNDITNNNQQINPRHGKSIKSQQALGDPAVNVEARFGKKLCKWSGFCKGKGVHPSEVVYVQPVKIQAFGDEIPAIIGTKKGNKFTLGHSSSSSFGHGPPAPFYPPPPIHHHHVHNHKHKNKKYAGGWAGLSSSSSGGGFVGGPPLGVGGGYGGIPPGVPYARDDQTYYDSQEGTTGGARVQQGGVPSGAGYANQNFGSSYTSGAGAGAGATSFSKRGPRQQNYVNGNGKTRRQPNFGPGPAAVNPQAFQVQAQVAQAQLQQLQQQQQYGQQQPNYQQPPYNPAPQQNFANNYPPQPAYNPAGAYPPQQLPYQNQPAYLPPAGKSNDCVCVPASSCAPQDVLGRELRPTYQYNQLDPRNKFKNQQEGSTDEYSDIADSINDGIESYYSDNEARNAKSAGGITALTEEEVKELDTKAETNEKKSTRRKRDAEAQQNTDVEVPDLSPAVPESRQLGGNGVCSAYEVCCRNPLSGGVGGGRPPTNNGQCGVRYARGITGRVKTLKYVDGDAEFGEYPWQAAILKKEGLDNVYVCGGTLIDGQHIATAAHCIKGYAPGDLRVRLGEWDVNHDTEFYTHVEKDVVAVVIHPEFYAGSLYNDIALLRIDSYVDFTRNPHVSPVCLPSQYAELPAGYRCWTTGWGKDAWGNQGTYQNILKEVDVPLVQHQRCEQQLKDTRLGVSFNLHEGFLCAGGEQGKDACKGDGGGPLVCDIQGTWQLAGIVSWGIGCGQQDVPGVYVKVSHYLPWIQSVTRSTLG